MMRTRRQSTMCHKVLVISTFAIAASVLSAALSGCVAFECTRVAPQQYVQSSISEDPTRVDRSLITGGPCEPPCWQGLVPGESTTADALAALEEASFVDATSIQHNSYHEGETIYWQSAIADYPTDVGVIDLNRGRISYIKILLEYELTLQELAEVVGEPDGYLVYAIPAMGSTRCYNYDITFVWSEEGLAARVYFDSPNLVPQHEQLLSPDELFVMEVVYFPPATSVLGYLTALGVSEEVAQEESEGDFQEWQGFDSIVMP